MEESFTLWKSIFEEGKKCFKEEKDKIKADSTIQAYFEECKTNNGAVLFMVHSGKYSEGFNFKDNRCRAIIMVGIPNRPLASAKVCLKKKFYNEATNKKLLQGEKFNDYYYRYSN
jgi:Rad3-related DNA helicase